MGDLTGDAGLVKVLPSPLVTHLWGILLLEYKDPLVEAARAGLFWVSIQSPEVYGAGLFQKVKEEVGRANWTPFIVSPTLLEAVEFKALCPPVPERSMSN